MLAVAIGIHVLGVVIWIGGMFFVHTALRPVLTHLLEPPLQMRCWAQIFARFFVWVWIAVLSLFISGAWITLSYGGMGKVGVYIHLMVGLAVVMAMIFAHIFFAPYRRFKQAIAQEDFTESARRLKQIRLLMTINLVLGLLVTVIGATGRIVGNIL